MASVRKRTWTHNGQTKEAWVVAYADQAGKRRLKTFDKKKDADKHRVKVEGEIERGEHVPQVESGTVRALADAYSQHNAQRFKDGKIGQNRHDQVEMVIRIHILPTLGKKLFNDLTFSDLETWHAEMAKGGRCAPQTRANYMEVLGQIEKFAYRRGLTKRTPVRDFGGEIKAGVRRSVIRTFTAEQVGFILSAIEERQPGRKRRPTAMLRCAIHLAAFCGLRRGEIFGLTRDCLDLPGRTVRIRHNLTQHDVLKGPKTAAGRRDVPIPPHVAVMLGEWMDEHMIADERGVVFRTDRGGTYAMQNFLTCMWRPFLRRIGLETENDKGFHFHALRHFAASWMIENRLSLPDVAALLGHAKFDMTLQVYAHPIIGGGHRHAAMDRMAASLLLGDATHTRHEVVSL